MLALLLHLVNAVTVSMNCPIMANHFERVGRKVTGLSLPQKGRDGSRNTEGKGLHLSWIHPLS